MNYLDSSLIMAVAEMCKSLAAALPQAAVVVLRAVVGCFVASVLSPVNVGSLPI